MIVLDTNVLSELMKAQPSPGVRDWLLQLGDVAISTTTISIFEIEYGLARLPSGRRRDDLTERFNTLTSAMSILPLDDMAARAAGRLRASRDASGLTSQPSDMMIGGIAFVTSAMLATRNIRDFEGLPLRLVDPWRSH
ncbi:PIN domain-containing protein [Caulobacter segnis]|uniref:PIN domain-containing protein n=1 Tax=Caulobacter segnis TaxID=88688 RepID=UPI00240F6F15|nr:PIN domain-containing protein [Caulobacter segnis]MDG2520315.1 PIN domain-containing protein [Caulobacter segnis]